MQTTWRKAVFQTSKWILLSLTPLETIALWRWKSVPVHKDTEDRPARSALKATPAPALGFTWARVRGATATATPAAVTQRLEHVCNVSTTRRDRGATAVRLVTMETRREVALRPANPALVQEQHPAPNSQRPATWTPMVSLHVTVAPLDTPGAAVRDVPPDTMATHNLDRGALETTL